MRSSKNFCRGKTFANQNKCAKRNFDTNILTKNSLGINPFSKSCTQEFVKKSFCSEIIFPTFFFVNKISCRTTNFCFVNPQSYFSSTIALFQFFCWGKSLRPQNKSGKKIYSNKTLWGKKYGRRTHFAKSVHVIS